MNSVGGMNGAQELVTLILSGGGAAAIFTLVKALLAFRGSTDSREATAIGNLERWRLDADKRADDAYTELAWERTVSAFWQGRAAEVEHQARLHGVNVTPCTPPVRPAPNVGGPSVTT